MSEKFYKAVGGISDGFSHHVSGAVFPATQTLDTYFDLYDGKDGDRVLFEPATKEEYLQFIGVADAAAGAPTEIVGSLPTGEDSLAETQRDAEGNALVNPDAKVKATAKVKADAEQ